MGMRTVTDFGCTKRARKGQGLRGVETGSGSSFRSSWFLQAYRLEKLTKPGALILNLSSTYSTVRLIDVACRSSVSATNLGSRSYRLRRNVLGPITVIE